MRTIQLHPLSVFAGIGIAALAFVAMAQTPQAIDPELRRQPQPAIAARDMVQIRGGTSFVVPVGKLFVLTAMGDADGQPYAVYFRVNGQFEAMASANAGIGNGMSMKQSPLGCTAQAGSMLTVEDSNSTTSARAWGYLADA